MTKSDILYGGHNLYGYTVGILMIEGKFPRPVGAIGNAATFPFPVFHHVVKGASGARTVREIGTMNQASQAFEDAIAPWIEGAQLLQAQGCTALTTSCGFAILFQKRLAEAVSIPVFSSALLLGPLILAGLGRDKRLGIMTADAACLSNAHLDAAGLEADRLAIAGMESSAEFCATAWDDREWLEVGKAKQETITIAKRLCAEHPDIGAILLECSLLPPYAAHIHQETALPVFDFTTLVNFLHHSVARQPFQ